MSDQCHQGIKDIFPVDVRVICLKVISVSVGEVTQGVRVFHFPLQWSVGENYLRKVVRKLRGEG